MPVAAVCSAAVSPVAFFANRHVLAGATFVPRAVQVIIAVLFLHWAHWLSRILADFDVDEYKVVLHYANMRIFASPVAKRGFATVKMFIDLSLTEDLRLDLPSVSVVIIISYSESNPKER